MERVRLLAENKHNVYKQYTNGKTLHSISMALQKDERDCLYWKTAFHLLQPFKWIKCIHFYSQHVSQEL